MFFCICSKLSLDLIEKWLSSNLNDSMLGRGGDRLNINGILTYQPNDGLTELKVVMHFIFISFFLKSFLLELAPEYGESSCLKACVV